MMSLFYYLLNFYFVPDTVLSTENSKLNKAKPLSSGVNINNYSMETVVNNPVLYIQELLKE